MENSRVEATGRCLCGDVQFEINSPLRHIVNCHCSKCRRFHGNFGAYTMVDLKGFVLLEKRGLKWYKSSTDETEGVNRGFCSTCGSSLFWHAGGRDTISVAAGALNVPTHLSTIGHIWTEQMGDYYTIVDQLPQYLERWG